MPPTGTTPNLFGERKVYIGTNLCDMKPLEEITRDAITVTKESPTPKIINATGNITLKIHCEIDPKLWEWFNKMNYFLVLWKKKLTGKPRKTTYKTTRKDCAKRNRHK